VVDLTIVCAVDRKTIEQFIVSVPTWIKYRPEMAEFPWMIIYDRAQLKLEDIRDVIIKTGLKDFHRDAARTYTGVMACPWPKNKTAQEWDLRNTDRPYFANQREKMLTAFVRCAPYIDTEWWAKIDTDAVALRPADWLPDEWFARDELVGARFYEPADKPTWAKYNVWIASPWSYTKPADQMAKLDDWADGIDFPVPRLDLPFDPDGRRCRHPRMASWVSFYRSDWTRYVSRVIADKCDPDKIPVPSQDGVHWYFSARMNVRTLRTSMKRRGWTNCPRMTKLRETAAKALSGGFENA